MELFREEDKTDCPQTSRFSEQHSQYEHNPQRLKA